MPSSSRKQKGLSKAGNGPAGIALIVEDNVFSQRVAASLLKQLNYTTHIARNGREAVEFVRHNHYCFILMDCHMPEMDGLEATAAIRQMEKTTGSHVPIFGFSADFEDASCLAVGMDAFVGKPIEMEVLKRVLSQFVEQANDARTCPVLQNC